MSIYDLINKKKKKQKAKMVKTATLTAALGVTAWCYCRSVICT